MKQFINIDQLQSLSDKGKNAILTVPQFCRHQYGGQWIADETKITIGRMIEFLDKKGVYLFKLKKMPSGAYRAMIWDEVNGDYKHSPMLNGDETSEDELCDALWEAVRGILET